MSDTLPQDTPVWQFVERTLTQLLASYGYEEIRFPIVESTYLFARSIGEVTDIVEKEMYSFVDRNGDSLSLRPEGTASCVRAGIQNGLLYNQTQRLWYMGPMFRHERPQKGRYRQFHQIGVETYGFAGPDIDVELILLTARMWAMLGIDNVRLELNTLGTSATRQQYRDDLTAYFRAHLGQLDEDSRNRLDRNPLRILDTKNPDMFDLVANAPTMIDYLDPESRDHFDYITSSLDENSVAYELNPRLVRGLDYYGLTVFEWITESLGSQGTICAGGRYDGLVEQLGGKPTPAIGCAVGLERIVAMLQDSGAKIKLSSPPKVYVVALGRDCEKAATWLIEQCRNETMHIHFTVNCGGGNLRKQLKRADKSNADIAVILGDNELANKQVSIKYLKSEQPDELIKHAELSGFLNKQFSS